MVTPDDAALAAALVGPDRPGPDDTAVRSLTPRQVLRVRSTASLVQLRLMPAATGTTVAFHEEHLPDERRRTLGKQHWTRLLEDLREQTCPPH